jgi:hypothetical protein
MPEQSSKSAAKYAGQLVLSGGLNNRGEQFNVAGEM